MWTESDRRPANVARWVHLKVDTEVTWFMHLQGLIIF